MNLQLEAASIAKQITNLLRLESFDPRICKYVTFPLAVYSRANFLRYAPWSTQLVLALGVFGRSVQNDKRQLYKDLFHLYTSHGIYLNLRSFSDAELCEDKTQHILAGRHAG